MPRRTTLLALLVTCLTLSGCTAEQERAFFLHVILFCFGVGAASASLGGGAVALVRAAQRKGRSFVNFALAIPFTVTTLLLHALVTEGFTRAVPGFDRDSLWLFAMTSAPLFWLAATIVELVIAPPPTPPGPPGPPRPEAYAPVVFAPVDPLKVVSAVFVALLVIAGYGALIVNTLPPGKSSSTLGAPPVTPPMIR